MSLLLQGLRAASKGPLRTLRAQPNLRSGTRSRAYSAWGARPGGYSVITGIIAVDVAVFAAYQYAGPPGQTLIPTSDVPIYRFIMRNFTTSVAHLKENKYYTLLTANFTHLTPYHLIANLFSIQAFGTIISMLPGMTPLKMATLALGSGLAGCSFWIVRQMTRPQGSSSGPRRIASGSSGMIMGIATAAALAYPMQQVLLFFFPIRLWLLVPAYVAFDTYYLDSEGSSIAHAGHLGGAAFGLMYYFLRLRRGPLTSSALRWRGRP